MKIYNKFVESKKEPQNKNDIWFDGSSWKMYKEGMWRSFTLPLDAAVEINKILQEDKSVLQQELKNYLKIQDSSFEKGSAENSAVLKGGNNKVTNANEVALGKYNISNSDTRFSIGIGTSGTGRKNAFEVKQNGDIYIEGVEGRIQDKLNATDTLDAQLAELSAEIVGINSEVGNLYSEKPIVLGETYTNTIYGTFKKGQIVRITIKTDVEIRSGDLRLFDDKGQIMTISSSAQDLDVALPNDTSYLQIYLYSSFVPSNGTLSFAIITNLSLEVSELILIKEELGGEKNYTSGGYLARPSSVIAADGYAYTDYIPVEPSVSITAYHGYVDKTLTLLEYGEDLQYLDYWSQSIGTTSRTITTSANTRYVRFSFMEKNAPSVYLECNGKKVWSAYSMGALDKVNALWDKNSYPTEYEGCEVSVFTKCMCIGDSLTAGVFNKQDGYETIAKYSYPSIFSKITGVETINKGVGGITSEQWYAQFSSESWSGCDMAIIQLGVNDAIQNEGWTSASKTAITNIINKLKADNQGIKIFVATIIPATSYMGEKYDSVSDGIRALVAELADKNVILVDIAQFGHSADNVAYNVGHLSAYGYWRLAKDYMNYISWIMANNMSVFRDIQFIGTSFVLA